MILQSIDAFTDYHDRYRDLPMQGMRVTCELQNNRVAGFEPGYLDNILAAAVVRETGVRLETNNGLYDIPIPLRVAYESPDGRKLFASSCLVPPAESFEDRTYLHRRRQTGRYTAVKTGRFNIDPQRGRWMERRYVVKSTVSDSLVAYAIGDPKEVARLLQHIGYIGKYRSVGYGHVRKWTIEPMTLTIQDVFLRDGKLSRNIPFDACESIGITPPEIPTHLCPWTPPYWHGASMSPGWRVGTQAMGTEVGGAV